MGLFGKKLSDEELIQKNIQAQQAEIEEKSAAGKKDENSLGESRLAIEITKIKAQLEGLNEQRKATTERFSRVSEELGELRGMIVETNKGVSRIEAASTKAIDLVSSVKPEQLMLEIRKLDSKIEALKANLEGNETMMGDSMKELKEIRKKMDFYKGAEQIAKMNDEVKGELINIKKSEGVIERHSNKVESIYIDVEKKYSELDQFTSASKDLRRSFDKLSQDVDKLRVKTEDGVEKKELVKLISKFNDFEKHTSNILNLLDKKSKSVNESINKEMGKVSARADAKVNAALKKLNVEIDVPEDKSEIVQEKKPKFSFKGILKKRESLEDGEKTSEESKDST